jgi:hypothetical protein
MNTQRGFISAIVSIIVSLVVLGYFNIDLKEVFSRPEVMANLHFGWELLVQGFHSVQGLIIK